MKIKLEVEMDMKLYENSDEWLRELDDLRLMIGILHKKYALIEDGEHEKAGQL